MERELLLLGLLRQHEMYGYQINDLIDAHLSYSIKLTKPTAYRILNNMAEQGWISFREEQVGKRPTRRIYSLTEQGEKRFQELVRISLRNYEPIDAINITAMAFVETVPLNEILSLLEERRDSIERLISKLHSDDNHHGGFGIIIKHQIRHLETDLEWLSDIIDHYASGTGVN